jgi:putative ABC transport system ATP-binding protein
MARRVKSQGANDSHVRHPQDLSRRPARGGGPGRLHAAREARGIRLDHPSFRIRQTTFLNIAGLLDGFDAGEYRLAGVDVRTLSDDAQSRLRNQHIGFVFQSFNLIPDLDVWDNVEVPLRYRKMTSSERRRRIDEVLERVGLTSRSSYLPSQLSGGQQQRVAIARALVGKPDLILADEPTGNLDSLMARQVMDILQQISEAGTTIVVVTHSQEIASRTQRKLHVLDGRVIDPWAERPSLSEAS